MRTYQYYYRGSLKSCNYTCSYCPFSKHKTTVRELEKDKKELDRFVAKIMQQEQPLAVQIVPYGEALLHRYYWESLAKMCQKENIELVGAQSNFSFSVKEMLTVFQNAGGVLDKLRLWGTFHPQMTTVQAFAEQCKQLQEAGVKYCVGAVGVPEQLPQIRRLRKEIPESVYLWINKMDGLQRRYTQEEIAEFSQIDEYFSLECEHHKADSNLCQGTMFVEAGGKVFPCNICKHSIGNIYTEEGEKKLSYCTRKECTCYLAYCNRKEAAMLFFGTYPAFRIPVYPKAAFFDVDGTLVPEGASSVPKQYCEWLGKLAKHSDIYLVTALPYIDAVRKTKDIQPLLAGGVYAGGGMGKITKQGEKTEWINAMSDQIMPLLVSLQKRYHFQIYTYQKEKKYYKITLVCKRAGMEELFLRLKTAIEQAGEYHVVKEENKVQITAKNVDKLSGIVHICEKMKYDKKGIAVFGNADNDAAMLSQIPFSVAVEKSSEKAKQAAAIVISDGCYKNKENRL